MSQDGGPAFPGTHGNDYRGMSLRDYFAGQALTALWSAPVEVTGKRSGDDLAALTYKIADAMLEARKRVTKTKKENDL